MLPPMYFLCKNDTKLSNISPFLFLYRSTRDICFLLPISLASSANIVKYILSFTSETIFFFMYSVLEILVLPHFGLFWADIVHFQVHSSLEFLSFLAQILKSSPTGSARFKQRSLKRKS